MKILWDLAVSFLLMASFIFMFAYDDFNRAIFCLAMVWLYKDG